MTGEGKERASRSEQEPRNRIESVSGGIGPAEKPASESRSARDWLDTLFDMPSEERFLAAASVVALIAFAFAKGWRLLFQFGETGGWFVTFALPGAIASATLLLARRFGVALLAPAVRARALLVAALLPVLGLAIELLGEIWSALLLASALGMARAAVRINRRDDLFKW